MTYPAIPAALATTLRAVFEELNTRVSDEECIEELALGIMSEMGVRQSVAEDMADHFFWTELTRQQLQSQHSACEITQLSVERWDNGARLASYEMTCPLLSADHHQQRRVAYFDTTGSRRWDHICD